MFAIEQKTRGFVHTHILDILLDGLLQTFGPQHRDQDPLKYFFDSTVETIDRLHEVTCPRSLRDPDAFVVPEPANLQARGPVHQYVLDNVSKGLVENLGETSTAMHNFMFRCAVKSVDMLYSILLAKTPAGAITIPGAHAAAPSTSAGSPKRRDMSTEDYRRTKNLK